MTNTATAARLTVVPDITPGDSIADAALAWLDAASALTAELRKVDYVTGLTASDREALRRGCRAQRDVIDRLAEIAEAAEER